MGLEENKKVVVSFFENFSAETVRSMMADNATWTVMGKPENFALAGTQKKAEFVEGLQGLIAAMPNGLRITVKSVVAEGDRVAVEAESYGELVNGKVYNNQYHFLVELQGGKIQAVREYCDTLHAKDVFLG
jgi:uncharacterized protein